MFLENLDRKLEPALRLTPCPKWELSKKKVGT